jgi:hypothetical protein
MHKWMASAAGGTNHRLYPSPAMMRSLDKKPGVVSDMVLVASAGELMMSPVFLGVD